MDSDMGRSEYNALMGWSNNYAMQCAAMQNAENARRAELERQRLHDIEVEKQLAEVERVEREAHDRARERQRNPLSRIDPSIPPREHAVIAKCIYYALDYGVPVSLLPEFRGDREILTQKNA